MLKPAKTSQAPSKVTKAVPDSSKSSQPTPGPSKAPKAAPSTTVSSPTTLTVKTTRKSKQIMSEESCNRFWIQLHPAKILLLDQTIADKYYQQKKLEGKQNSLKTK